MPFNLFGSGKLPVMGTTCKFERTIALFVAELARKTKAAHLAFHWLATSTKHNRDRRGVSKASQGQPTEGRPNTSKA